jgi:hypothetical protein
VAGIFWCGWSDGLMLYGSDTVSAGVAMRWQLIQHTYVSPVPVIMSLAVGLLYVQVVLLRGLVITGRVLVSWLVVLSLCGMFGFLVQL